MYLRLLNVTVFLLLLAPVEVSAATGELVRNPTRLPAYLFERSQELDRLSTARPPAPDRSDRELGPAAAHPAQCEGGGAVR